MCNWNTLLFWNEWVKTLSPLSSWLLNCGGVAVFYYIIDLLLLCWSKHSRGKKRKSSEISRLHKKEKKMIFCFFLWGRRGCFVTGRLVVDAAQTSRCLGTDDVLNFFIYSTDNYIEFCFALTPRLRRGCFFSPSNYGLLKRAIREYFRWGVDFVCALETE